MYVDQSVTHKACAGLNGLKLGGQVITAVEAVKGFSLGNGEDQNSCIVPELARSLLQKPTQVVKLKNVHANGIITNGENNDDNTRETGNVQNVVDDEINVETKTTKEAADGNSGGTAGITFPCATPEVVAGYSISAAGAQLDTEMAAEDPTLEILVNTTSQDVPNPIHISKEESNYHSDKYGDNNFKSETANLDEISGAEENANLDEISGAEENANPEEINRKLPEGHTKVAIEDPAFKNKNLLPREDSHLEEGDGRLPEAIHGSADSARTELDGFEKDEKNKDDKLKQIFEPGCVFVEYGGTEASCTAAHSIHGRLFDNRLLTVEYIDPNLYR
ncbi:hypothetical protein F3Y22_tig00110987pilonHSYRG00283 [Hibiscus syriacus]|uniref:RRM domain-containing protein n=1 Tax=Hibiscus syriacus TaxID=106335 RepID=A0A6A2Z8V3_HIBSY|nr:hypothetical protein F3Y22_tig00110987pilonHSYRG00283 [Hibiscus syriacus]